MKFVLILLDILADLALLAVSVSNRGLDFPAVFWTAAGLALLARACREWETLAACANPFCINRPLFVLNNVKLAGLALIMILKVVQ